MTSDAVLPACGALPSVSAAAASAGLSLADLPVGTAARVRATRPGVHAESAELVLRLLEIGFVAGEAVHVVARGRPGGEPLAVRIGGTTFALRRFEALHVLVDVDPAPGRAA